ncbi:MAG TPA: hypothetical protein VIU15_37845 [Streptomyces sp.]
MTTSVLPDLERPTVGEAMAELSCAFRAGGLAIVPSPSKIRPGRGVDLGEVTLETALELAELIQQGLEQAHRTAEDLWGVFEAHGLEMPVPFVTDLKIHLGDVSLDTADHLAFLLGAPRWSDPSLSDEARGRKTTDRLTAAFAGAVDGAGLDVHFHPGCRRCDEESAISLGPLSVQHAHRLAHVLQFGVRP